MPRLSVGRAVASSNPPRSPLPANNDHLDKARRRKRRRTVLTKDGILGDGRRKSVLAKPRKSMLPPPHLSGLQLTELYSSCLKMSAENKINAKNTWGLNLIDYMDDVVEEDETDFARASCTIDASIKIYSTRVDAVHMDTYKVLGGLARTNTNDGPDPGAGNENDANNANASDFDDDDDDDDAYVPGGRAKKKKAKAKKGAKDRVSATLEKNVSALNTSELNLDHDSDPLFQKTSAEFDEGGARGLLLNHLTLSEHGQLIFGSHVPFRGIASADAGTLGSDPTLEFDHARKVYGDPEFAVLSLCPEFTSYAAQRWSRPSPYAPAAAAAAADSPAAADAPVSDFVAAMTTLGGDAEDFAWEDPVYDAPPSDDDSDDDAGHSSMGIGMSSFSSNASSQADALATVFGAGAADASAASALDAALRMTKDANGASEYAFFAPAKIKGWAGPQHWKYSRPSKAASGANKSSAKKKAKFYLELSPPLELDLAVLGKTSSKSTTLKSSSRSKSTSAYLLPEDLHYDLAKITHFELRPKFSLFSAGSAAGPARRGGPGHTLAGDSQAPRGGGGGFFGFDDGDDDNGDWANYGQNDHGFDDDDDDHLGGGAGGIDLLDDPRRVGKVDIHHSHIAKRVDVKALKKGVWAKLTEPEPRQALVARKTPETTMPSDSSMAFSEVVQALPDIMPKRKMNDASVQFAFICLLHLCNENGLMIEEQDSLNDFVVRQDPTVPVAH